MKRNKKSAGIIYSVNNKITGEYYVGATSKSLEERKKDHLNKAEKRSGHYFHEAISTYGPDAFIWEHLDTANSVDELAQKEREYIVKYDSKQNGYNGDSGGGFKKTVYQYSLENGTLVNSYDSLESASNAVNANKKQISRACLNVNKIFRGYHWSYERMDFFPSIHLDMRSKQVLQFDLEGKYIAVYKSVNEASQMTGCNKFSIAKVCRGERNKAGGYFWKYIFE